MYSPLAAVIVLLLFCNPSLPLYFPPFCKKHVQFALATPQKKCELIPAQGHLGREKKSSGQRRERRGCVRVFLRESDTQKKVKRCLHLERICQAMMKKADFDEERSFSI